ncbi:MAG: 3-deoxy-8-phosphooctulonate synthase [Rickettsiales bacterium]|jgi:2-dehydro-3-deoxyphosphooctonate aldolase (KDO 8-P synthase)|nr:3-deoxy-8-phosphooctulonate synthase [Rickettsiales bacterium]
MTQTANSKRKTKNIVIPVGDFKISNDLPFILMAGPCAMESMEHAIFMATEIKKICDKLGIHYIFKSSFDKANRSSATGKRGVGIDAATEVFQEIKKKIGCPTITDVHTPEQYKHKIMQYVDVAQVPAFLCRQTDLLKAAAESGKIINVKKGQFISPKETHYIFEKMKYFGNTKVILCDRGTFFGYNALINDMTCYPIMAETGCPVCCDCTHSCARPGAGDGCSLGYREMAEVIARAAVGVGVAAVFAEVHQDPDTAPCDGPNMIRLDQLKRILTKLVEIDKVVKNTKK